jgi:hypothetical protein
MVGLAAALMEGEGVPRDRAEAARLYRRAATAGSPDAMYELAICLRDALGLPRDRAAALRWLRRAAARGHPGAAALVGQAYWWGGLGVSRDRERAAPFLLAAARRGEARAASLLGVEPGPRSRPAARRGVARKRG